MSWEWAWSNLFAPFFLNDAVGGLRLKRRCEVTLQRGPKNAKALQRWWVQHCERLLPHYNHSCELLSIHKTSTDRKSFLFFTLPSKVMNEFSIRVIGGHCCEVVVIQLTSGKGRLINFEYTK